VLSRALQALNLLRSIAVGKECIGNQRTMATPRYCLGAHDSGLFEPSQLHQPAQPTGKFGSLHVVGKASKASIAPSGVEGAWLRVAESPQGRHVQVANPCTPKRRAYLLSIKLRVVPRSWDGAHIHKPLHSMCFQQLDEVFLLPR